jgi:hypothetical protein
VPFLGLGILPTLPHKGSQGMFVNWLRTLSVRSIFLENEVKVVYVKMPKFWDFAVLVKW